MQPHPLSHSLVSMCISSSPPNTAHTLSSPVSPGAKLGAPSKSGPLEYPDPSHIQSIGQIGHWPTSTAHRTIIYPSPPLTCPQAKRTIPLPDDSDSSLLPALDLCSMGGEDTTIPLGLDPHDSEKTLDIPIALPLSPPFSPPGEQRDLHELHFSADNLPLRDSEMLVDVATVEDHPLLSFDAPSVSFRNANVQLPIWGNLGLDLSGGRKPESHSANRLIDSTFPAPLSPTSPHRERACSELIALNGISESPSYHAPFKFNAPRMPVPFPKHDSPILQSFLLSNNEPDNQSARRQVTPASKLCVFSPSLSCLPQQQADPPPAPDSTRAASPPAATQNLVMSDENRHNTTPQTCEDSASSRLLDIMPYPALSDAMDVDDYDLFTPLDDLPSEEYDDPLPPWGLPLPTSPAPSWDDSLGLPPSSPSRRSTLALPDFDHGHDHNPLPISPPSPFLRASLSLEHELNWHTQQCASTSNSASPPSPSRRGSTPLPAIDADIFQSPYYIPATLSFSDADTNTDAGSRPPSSLLLSTPDPSDIPLPSSVPPSPLTHTPLLLIHTPTPHSSEAQRLLALRLQALAAEHESRQRETLLTDRIATLSDALLLLPTSPPTSGLLAPLGLGVLDPQQMRARDLRAQVQRAIAARAEERRRRKREKERGKELLALLQLKGHVGVATDSGASGSRGNEATLVLSATGTERLRSSGASNATAGAGAMGGARLSRRERKAEQPEGISKLVAKMIFRRRDSPRPLSSRQLGTTDRKYVQSSLSHRLDGTRNGSDAHTSDEAMLLC